MKDLLIEITTENSSPEFIQSAQKKYPTILSKIAKEFRLIVSKQDVYITPQRIVFYIQFTSSKQQGGIYEIKGPEKNICFNHNNTPTLIYKKFLKQKGSKDSNIIVKKIRGKDYIFIQSSYEEKQIKEILPEFISLLMDTLRIGKKVRHVLGINSENNLYSLIKDIPKATKFTTIQRKEYEVDNINHYFSLIKSSSIYLTHKQRLDIIKEELLKIEEALSIKAWDVHMNVLANLSEQPQVYLTHIKKELLNLPEDILWFYLKHHPRVVFFKKNNKNTKNIALVLEKNIDDKTVKSYVNSVENQLTTLQDMYNEAIDVDFNKSNDRLKNIVFLEDLGTMYDKVQRVKQISAKISDLLSIGEPIRTYTQKAAELSKLDLTHRLVLHYPELHGLIGKHNVLKGGEKQEVAQAVAEYVLPIKCRPQLPQTMAGSILSIADKIDTIVGLFSVGLVLKGSDDPYKIKAKADGIIRIIERTQMDISLKRITNLSINLYESFHILKQKDKENLLNDILSFFCQRIKHYLEKNKYQPQIIEALIANKSTNITLITGKGEFLQNIITTTEFEEVRETFNRLKNLINDNPIEEIELEFLMDDIEKKLYENFLYYKKHYYDKVDRGEFENAFYDLHTLKNSVDKFLNSVYVYTDDEAIRRNRINILTNIYDLYLDFCDFSKF